MNRIFTSVVGATFAALALAIPASADTVITSGTFTGASNHITTGGVSVVKTSDGKTVLILGSDFSLDGAPDPSVGFGKNGKFVSASDLGKLTSINGKQVFVVPASVNVEDFNEIYIWCEKFSVPLGVASIN